MGARLSSGAMLAAALALISSGHAEATVTVLRWSGTVSSGSDTGVFSAAGGDLAGQAFTYVETVDDAVATPYAYAVPNAFSDLYGGPIDFAGDPSPASGILTVGGQPAPTLGDNFGQVYASTDYGAAYGNNGQYSVIESRTDSVDAHGDRSSVDLLVVDYFNTLSLGWDYHAPETLVLGPGLQARGGPADIFFDRPDVGPAEAHLRLTATSLVIGPALPEPATWSLMVVGFAGLGAIRRRRGSARVAKR